MIKNIINPGGRVGIVSMEKTAQLVLNSYDSLKIETAISNIKKSKSKLNVKLGEPVTSKSKVKIWGCQTNGLNLRQKTMSVSGSQEDLKRLLLKLKVTEGVYIQLLPNQ